METIRSHAQLRTQLQRWRQAKHKVAFVPTMGNLHAGHLSLVQYALTQADRVIVSIFVNPLQFGAGEDYQHYPRTLAADSAQLQQAGVHLLFTPTVSDIYPQGLELSTQVEVPQLSEQLCGAYRPGHFRGVATVVNKLLNLVQPDILVLGDKDYQQLLIIRRMVADLFIPVDVIGCPTVRETDGLAMSSRNHYLTPPQRQVAGQLFQTLTQIAARIEAGDHDFPALEQYGQQQLSAQGFKPDYVAVRCSNTLATPRAETTALIILAAAYLGTARLIDNVVCRQTRTPKG